MRILSPGPVELLDHPFSLDIRKALVRMKRRDYLTLEVSFLNELSTKVRCSSLATIYYCSIQLSIGVVVSSEQSDMSRCHTLPEINFTNRLNTSAKPSRTQIPHASLP